MKLFSAFIMTLFFMATSANATPAEMKLVAPSTIKQISKGRLVLTFQLTCSSEAALDWSQVVMTNDDSGDMTAAIGLVYSSSDSVCEKSSKLKNYEITVDPAKYGYPVDETSDFEPMDLAN